MPESRRSNTLEGYGRGNNQGGDVRSRSLARATRIYRSLRSRGLKGSADNTALQNSFPARLVACLKAVRLWPERAEFRSNHLLEADIWHESCNVCLRLR